MGRSPLSLFIVGTFFIVGETLGILLIDTRSNAQQVFSCLPSPQYLDIASRQLIHADASANGRFIFILSTRGIHVVDLLQPLNLAVWYAHPDDDAGPYQSIACGVAPFEDARCVIWWCTRDGVVFARKCFAGGVLSDQVLRSNSHKGVRTVHLLADRVNGNLAYMTTTAGCVIVLNLASFVDDSDYQPTLLPVQAGPIITADINNAGTALALGGADGVVRVWDIARGALRHSTPHRHEGISHKLSTTVGHCLFLT